MSNKRKKKDNNSGMSLVEIIVVVLILGVMASATFLGVDYLKRSDAKSTAEMIKSAIDRTRMLTISASEDRDIQLKIGKNEKGFYCEISQKNGEEREIIDTMTADTNKVTVSADTIKIVKNSIAVIKFDKDNGSSSCTYKDITVSGAGKTVTVHLVLNTGRTYYK